MPASSSARYPPSALPSPARAASPSSASALASASMMASSSELCNTGCAPSMCGSCAADARRGSERAGTGRRLASAHRLCGCGLVCLACVIDALVYTQERLHSGGHVRRARASGSTDGATVLQVVVTVVWKAKLETEGAPHQSAAAATSDGPERRAWTSSALRERVNRPVRLYTETLYCDCWSSGRCCSRSPSELSGGPATSAKSLSSSTVAASPDVSPSSVVRHTAVQGRNQRLQ
jgi:hypothetical protein